VRNLTPEKLAEYFPKLTPKNHETKSQATPKYNCLAFAMGDTRHWWEHGKPGGRYYWPPGRNDTVDSLIAIFKDEGFELTNNHDVEPGFEKIAIYVGLDDFLWSHVAKSDGHVWKSKLGKGQDIYHYSLDVLEGLEKGEYGIVDSVLKRPARTQ
jgi:hypothetical protein